MTAAMTEGSPTAAPTRLAARTVGLGKAYGRGDTAVEALRDVTLDFPAGRFAAVMGPSGSGKSTLLHCMAALETPTSGTVWIGDTDISHLSEGMRTLLRRERIGFVFQAFNLVPTLDAAENIALPQRLAGHKPDKAHLDRILDALGLRNRLKHRPAELSGGQQQRVAVARALAGKPDIVFADEPTGNLDSKAGAELLGFLRSSVHEQGQTVIMVTHDPNAAAYADRVVFLADGAVADQMTDPAAERVLEHLKSLDTLAGGR